MRNFLTLFFALAFSVSSAQAGGTLTLMGFGGPGEVLPPATVVYRGTQTCSSAVATCTYSNAPIGAASAGRIVVATVGGCSGLANAVTIGGASPTTVFNGVYGRIFYRAIPTGTTATVSSPRAGGGTCTQSISVFTVDDLQSSTPIDSQTSASSSANPKSVTLTTLPGSVAIAIVAVAQTSGTNTLTGVTQDQTTGVFTGTIVTVGSIQTTSSSVAITATGSAANTIGNLAAVAWR